MEIEKEKEKISAIDFEIRSYEAKLKEMKKGLEKTIHDISNGIVIYLYNCLTFRKLYFRVVQKGNRRTKKISISTSKVIKSPESCLYQKKFY